MVGNDGAHQLVTLEQDMNHVSACRQQVFYTIRHIDYVGCGNDVVNVPCAKMFEFGSFLVKHVLSLKKSPMWTDARLNEAPAKKTESAVATRINPLFC